MARNSFTAWFSQKNNLAIFLTGKIIRYIFYFSFLYLLLKNVKYLAGYDSNQVLFFSATYLLVDVVSQFFFRHVYSFRPLVVTGDLDLILLKPMNPLFRSLMGAPDAIDFITIPPIIAVVVYLGSLLNPSLIHVSYYLLLVLNGLIISMSFHILVLSFGIITLEVDHLVMIFRDLVSMGRLPVDIYKEPLKGVLTFLIPVGVMITLPAKALMGLVSPLGIISSLMFGTAFLFLSLRFWNFALKKYTSASS